MARARYFVGAALFCVVVGFALIHAVNGPGTAEDATKSTGANKDASLNIGTVLMWWGSPDAVPAGWEICDGQKPTTANAALVGNKPNLIERFPKGASSTRRNISDLSQATGGNNNMPALKISKIDGLKIVEDGAHTHTATDQQAAAKDAVEQADKKIARTGRRAADRRAAKEENAQTESKSTSEIVLAKGKGDGKKPAPTGDDDDANTEGMHSHDVKGFIGSENGINADGDDKTGANQPAFSELFFIIRVK